MKRITNFACFFLFILIYIFLFWSPQDKSTTQGDQTDEKYGKSTDQDLITLDSTVDVSSKDLAFCYHAGDNLEITGISNTDFLVWE